jgi:GAF domain-containing protein
VKTPFTQKLAAAGLHSFVAAPLLAESKVFGVFVATRREPASFSSGECEFLRQMSEHVALAAHQAQLYASLQRAYDDLQQTQQAVTQQDRLRVLGQMASGIAHDINNALSPMSLSTEMLLEMESELSPRIRKHLEMIREPGWQDRVDRGGARGTDEVE